MRPPANPFEDFDALPLRAAKRSDPRALLVRCVRSAARRKRYHESVVIVLDEQAGERRRAPWWVHIVRNAGGSVVLWTPGLTEQLLYVLPPRLTDDDARGESGRRRNALVRPPNRTQNAAELGAQALQVDEADFLATSVRTGGSSRFDEPGREIHSTARVALSSHRAQQMK